MFNCPNCKTELVKTAGKKGIFWVCPSCGGRSATIGLLRQNMPRETVNTLWQSARTGDYPQYRLCPACEKPMKEVPVPGVKNIKKIDVCSSCQFVWFDKTEYESLPNLPVEIKEEDKLSPEAREKIALIEIELLREERNISDEAQTVPTVWWKWLFGLLGMPIEYDENNFSRIPWITWLLALVIVIVSVISFSNLAHVVRKFGLIPADPLRYFGLTFVTSFFLHGSLFHLLGNVYFLILFGDNTEDLIGKKAFLLLLILSTLFGNLFHIMGNPNSSIPCIGASGGISGIITFYALKFPKVKLGFIFRILLYFRWIKLNALTMFFFWILLQFIGVWKQLNGYSNVSSLAHLGGVCIGFIFWIAYKHK